MTSKQEIVWTGTDADGFVGTVNSVALYKIRTVPYAPGPRRKDEKLRYTYLVRRLNTRSYEGVADTAHTADEAKTACEVDYTRNGGRAALHKTLGHALLIVEALGYRVSKPTLDDALAVVKAAGFRASKPKTPKRKSQRGPTFVCAFSDGETTRMSVHTSLENLDWNRGERLAREAYLSRWRTRARAQYRNNGQPCPVDLIAPVPPAIVSARFEQDGKVLAERGGVA